MVRRTRDELLVVAMGTMGNAKRRLFSVYRHGGAVLVTSRFDGHDSRHSCPAQVKTEEQIKRAIRVTFDVTDVTIVRLR